MRRMPVLLREGRSDKNEEENELRHFIERSFQILSLFWL